MVSCSLSIAFEFWIICHRSAHTHALIWHSLHSLTEAGATSTSLAKRNLCQANMCCKSNKAVAFQFSPFFRFHSQMHWTDWRSCERRTMKSTLKERRPDWVWALPVEKDQRRTKEMTRVFSYRESPRADQPIWPVWRLATKCWKWMAFRSSQRITTTRSIYWRLADRCWYWLYNVK